MSAREAEKVSLTESLQTLQNIEVASSPHLAERRITTRRMMYDVLIALAPAVITAAIYFRWSAAWQIGTALAFCLAGEAIFNLVRGKPVTILDGSAAVTAVIFALSLPPNLPLYATAIGAAVAILLGKMVFGGLGCNLFNPAMVGRAFLMACFPAAMVTWTAPALPGAAHIHAVTSSTPLAIAKFGPKDPQQAEIAGNLAEYQVRQDLMNGRGKVMTDLFLGATGGCLGETSAAALLIGGIYLILRGTACWRIPLGMLGAMALISAVGHAFWPNFVMAPLPQILAGGAMLGAFFIATDPVTSPITAWGRFVFGIGVGTFTMLIRLFGNYPEGVMYSVLIMNALTPILNRMFVPKPLGGPANG